MACRKKSPVGGNFVLPQDETTSNILFNHSRPQNPCEATSPGESTRIRERNAAIYREILFTLRFEPNSLVSFVPRDLIDHYILPMCDGPFPMGKTTTRKTPTGHSKSDQKSVRAKIDQKVLEFHSAFDPSLPRFCTPESKVAFYSVLGLFLREIKKAVGRAAKFDLFRDLYAFLLDANCFVLATSPNLATNVLEKITDVKDDAIENQDPQENINWLKKTERQIYAHCRNVKAEYKALRR